MSLISSRIDILNDKPHKVLLSICLPLILVNVVSLFTTTINNSIYSQYAGQTYFTVVGYISSLSVILSCVASSTASSAWIKTAQYYTMEDRDKVGPYLRDGIYAIVLAVVAIAGVMLAAMDVMLGVLKVPAEYYEAARQYYTLLCLSYLFIPISTLFLTIVNRFSSSRRILFVNLLNILITLSVLALVLIVFKGGMAGAAMLSGLSSLVLCTVCAFIMKKDGISLKGTSFKPNWKVIGGILKYAVIIALQSGMVTVGYFLVTLMSNRHLSAEFITVTNVSLAITGPMGTLTSAGNVFFPQNFSAGKVDRVKKFLWLSTSICVAYGFVCFAVYALLGNWYYGKLFTDPEVIRLGAQYWFWQGAGYVTISILYTVRSFYDAIGMGKLSLFSGIGEMAGNLIAALWLIPVFGNIGGCVAYPLGWTLAAAFLLIVYGVAHKAIFRKCVDNAALARLGESDESDASMAAG